MQIEGISVTSVRRLKTQYEGDYGRGVLFEGDNRRPLAHIIAHNKVGSVELCSEVLAEA